MPERQVKKVFNDSTRMGVGIAQKWACVRFTVMEGGRGMDVTRRRI